MFLDEKHFLRLKNYWFCIKISFFDFRFLQSRLLVRYLSFLQNQAHLDQCPFWVFRALDAPYYAQVSWSLKQHHLLPPQKYQYLIQYHQQLHTLILLFTQFYLHHLILNCRSQCVWPLHLHHSVTFQIGLQNDTGKCCQNSGSPCQCVQMAR